MDKGKIEKQIAKIESAISAADFWADKEKAQATLREYQDLKARIAGGGGVLGSFIDAGVADKVYAFYAPLLIGGDRAPIIGGRGADMLGEALRLKKVSVRLFEDNIFIEGYPR